MKTFQQVLCMTLLSAAACAAFAAEPAASAAPAATGQEDVPTGQVTTREQVRRELDLAVRYGLVNSGKPWDHWLDDDYQKREQAFERELARLHG
jgi:hypothetical protein